MDRAATIVIAEDEILIGDHMRITLESEGLTVVGVATTAAEALRISEQARPAVAVLDINLPDLDGVELAKRLQAQRSIEVVFVSGFGDADTRRRMETIAGSVFLQKPFNPYELIKAVRDKLKSRGQCG